MARFMLSAMPFTGHVTPLRAVAAALVTGKRGLIDEPTNDSLRAAGIYHVVSISGLHMMLAAGVFFWLTRAALALSPTLAVRWPLKKVAAVAGMAGATIYCVFSGADVAAERSLIMILVMQGAILFDRPALSMRNLAISALVVLTRERVQGALDEAVERGRMTRQDASELAAELATIGFISPGSVVSRYTSCGRAGCRCQGDPPQRHGRYYQWSRAIAGKTVSRRLNQDQAELYQGWIANRRRLEQLIAEMEEVSAAAGELLLHQAGASSPPRPAKH